MGKSAMTPDALPYRGTAAPFRVAVGLALAASAGVMLWGVGTHCVSASEFDRDAARETPMMTLEDRVAALTAELAQVKAQNAELRESQSDTSLSGRASPTPRAALLRFAPPPTRTRRIGALRPPRSRRISPGSTRRMPSCARAKATPPRNFPISGRAWPMPRSALLRCAPPPTRTRRIGALRLPRSRRISPS